MKDENNVVLEVGYYTAVRFFCKTVLDGSENF